MKTIVIFTNKKSSKVYGYGEPKFNDENFYEIKVDDKNRFLIADDGIGEKDVDNLFKALNLKDEENEKNKLFILYHSKPNKEKVIDSLKIKCEEKEFRVSIKHSNHGEVATYWHLKALMENSDNETLFAVFKELSKNIAEIPSMIKLHKFLVLEHLKDEKVNNQTILDKIKKCSHLNDAYEVIIGKVNTENIKDTRSENEIGESKHEDIDVLRVLTEISEQVTRDYV